MTRDGPTSSRARPEDEGDDPVPIDLGASSRQVGLMETGGGMPHGPAAVIIAVLAAVVITPIIDGIRAFFRRDR